MNFALKEALQMLRRVAEQLPSAFTTLEEYHYNGNPSDEQAKEARGVNFYTLAYNLADFGQAVAIINAQPEITATIDFAVVTNRSLSIGGWWIDLVDLPAFMDASEAYAAASTAGP